MRKTFKKIAAIAMATMTTLGCAMSTMAADAEPITKVTYKFECTSFVEAETLNWKMTTNANGWGDSSATYEVTKAGAFDLVVDIGTEITCFFNMGYFDAADGSETDNVYKCNAIVINGVEFTFSDDAAAVAGEIYDDDMGYARNNALFNVWGGLGQSGLIAQSAKGSTINGGAQDAGGISIVWSDTEFVADTTPDADDTTPDAGTDTTPDAGTTTPDAGTDTTPDAGTTTTPNTGDSSMTAMYLVVALAAAAVVLKKKTVTE